MLNKESNVLKNVKIITNLIILQDTKPTPSRTGIAGTLFQDAIRALDGAGHHPYLPGRGGYIALLGAYP